MASYGSASYGVDSYGQPDGPVTPTVGPITFTPAYALATAPVQPRGGALHLDRDLTTAALRANALGRPALCRGPARLVSRVIRALLTPQGEWWADPGYGSTLIVGQTVPTNAALAVSAVALHEAKTYQAGPLAPEERIQSIAVQTIRPTPDPREYAVSITITTAAGTSVPATLTL